MQLCMRVAVHACMHACICVCAQVCMCAYIHTRLYVTCDCVVQGDSGWLMELGKISEKVNVPIHFCCKIHHVLIFRIFT